MNTSKQIAQIDTKETKVVTVYRTESKYDSQRFLIALKSEYAKRSGLLQFWSYGELNDEKTFDFTVCVTAKNDDNFKLNETILRSFAKGWCLTRNQFSLS